MRKKILTLALAVVLTVSMIVPAFASEGSVSGDATEPLTGTIDVKVAISDQGEIAVAKDGSTEMAYVDVTVSDKNANGKFDIDDALYCAHETYYEGGAEAGYVSEISQYGRSLKTLWGEHYSDRDPFGYYVNNNSAWSLYDEVAAGDFVYAFIYKDQEGYSDKYSYFDESSKTVKAGESFELTLTALGYDASWQVVASPYANAGITVNGTSIDCQTDENGKVSLSLKTPGIYVISKDAAGDDELVPPVCVVTVTITGEIYDLSEVYKKTEAFVINDTDITYSNEWRVMALAKAGLLTEGQKNDFWMSECKKFSSGKTLSATSFETSIMSLALTGKSVFNIGGENLLAFIENEDNLNAINSQIFALIAFDIHDFQDIDKNYKENLISKIVKQQKDDGGWNYSSKAEFSDVDMTAMAVQALAPYTENNEVVEEAVANAKEFLLNALAAGNICSCESYAQVILAFNALGEEADSAAYEKVLAELLCYYNGDGQFCFNGAANYTSTTQAFYALVSNNAYNEDGTYLYSTTDHVFESIGTVETSGGTKDLTICGVCYLTRCESNGKIVDSLTGLAKISLESGEITKWLNFKNGVVDEVTGLVQKADGSDSNWYYVENGVYTKSTCFAQKVDGSSTDKYYVENGKLAATTGFVTVNSNKYYVKSGKLVTTTGFVTVDSNKYYVKSGKLVATTGFVTVGSDKYYVKSGKLVTTTGFVTVGSNKYYVKSGKLVATTGFVTVDSNKYYVKSGKLVATTGFVTVGSNKYYVKSGQFIKTTGLVKVNSKWYYVKSGKFTKKTGFVKKAGSKSSKKYYVKKGKFKKVTRTIKINGKKYKVVKGVYKGRIK